MNEQTRRRIEAAAEENYRQFNKSLLPGIENILGVRLPILHKMAKELIQQGWAEALEGEDLFYEERMLRGILIAQAPMSPEKRLESIRQFVPLIDNWGVCDSFCASLKPFIQEHFYEMLDFAAPYVEAAGEFEVRFGLVTLLSHFMLPETAERVFQILDNARHPGYYARAALAWALSRKKPGLTWNGGIWMILHTIRRCKKSENPAGSAPRTKARWLRSSERQAKKPLPPPFLGEKRIGAPPRRKKNKKTAFKN